MRKRHGRGEEAASKEVPGATATASSSADNDRDGGSEKFRKLATEAIRSIQTCYRIIFASVLADVLTTFIDNDIWTKLFNGSNNDGGSTAAQFTWLDLSHIVESLSMFAFACGLWRISLFMARLVTGREAGKQRVVVLNERVLSTLCTLSLTWEIVALNFAVVSVSMAAALPANGRGGPLDSLLGAVSSTSAASTAAFILFAGRISISAHCRRTAHSEDTADNERIAANQQESKSNAAFASSRKIGYQAYRNQAFCCGSYGLMAIMELLKWLADAKSGIIRRTLTISDVLAPFATARLLFKLNKSFLRAEIISLRLRNAGLNALDGEIYNDLFIAQAGFYSKVSDTVKDATCFRLLPYIVRPLVLQILSALEIISPSLATKIVEQYQKVVSWLG